MSMDMHIKSEETIHFNDGSILDVIQDRRGFVYVTMADGDMKNSVEVMITRPETLETLSTALKKMLKYRKETFKTAA